MPRFRSRPTEITAEQFLPPHYIPRGVKIENGGRAFVTTIHEQRVYLERGDWIVPEPDGIHFYPIKPDIFEKKYELILPGEKIRSELEEEGEL